MLVKINFYNKGYFITYGRRQGKRANLKIEKILFENLKKGAKLYHMASGHMSQTR